MEIQIPMTRFTEITASSVKSFVDAIDVGLNKAIKAIPNVTGIEIVSIKAKVDRSKISTLNLRL
jgi:flavin-binding protein dodecin